MRRLAELYARVARHPGPTLAVLCTVQALALLAFALRGTQHNGWLYYQGGDQIWYTTGASLLAHLQLPPTFVGYGWSMLVAPIFGAVGPDFLSGLPAVIVLDVVVLAPLGTLCVYGIGTRVGGRLSGLWCSLLWVAAPYVSLLFFTDRYHETWFDLALPQTLGLTAMADYPSMIALLAAAFFVVRSLRPGTVSDGVLAGLLAGLALGIKPSNALFLAGPALAYLVARRWREAAAFGIALLPAVLALAIWKERGLGNLPLFTLGETREAAGAAGAVAAVQVHKYVNIDLDQWRQNMSGLREFTVGARLVQWAPIAGVIGLSRRSVPAAALFAGWLGAYLLVKGTSPLATVESGSFWRFVMPAFPAYLFLAAAIPLLVPTLARRLGRHLEAPAPARRLGRGAVVSAAIVLAGIPLTWIAVSSPITSDRKAVLLDGILTPVDAGKIDGRVTARGAARRISWTRRSWPSDVFYRVYRTAGDGSDVDCPPTGGAAQCTVTMLLLGTTRKTAFLDLSPPAGVTYRVGVGANWVDDPRAGDVAVLSPPLKDVP
jgi:hypothetical protein